MEPYTVALTSCGRFDLLQRTLASLLPRLHGPLDKIIVVEDSGDLNVENVILKFSDFKFRIETIVNETQLGQVRSIDKLLSNVETEWVFTCEDDWEFISDGFLDKSYKLMKEFDSCSTVSLTGHVHSSKHFSKNGVAQCGLSFYVAESIPNWPYAGFFFGPGLKRMRDYRIVGPYDDLGTRVGEGMVASVYKDLGYRTLQLEQKFIQHIGWERHVYDPKREFKGLRRKINSLKRRAKQTYWMINPKTHPSTRVKRRFENELATMNRWKVW